MLFFVSCQPIVAEDDALLRAEDDLALWKDIAKCQEEARWNLKERTVPVRPMDFPNELYPLTMEPISIMDSEMIFEQNIIFDKASY